MREEEVSLCGGWNGGGWLKAVREGSQHGPRTAPTVPVDDKPVGGPACYLLPSEAGYGGGGLRLEARASCERADMARLGGLGHPASESDVVDTLLRGGRHLVQAAKGSRGSPEKPELARADRKRPCLRACGQVNVRDVREESREELRWQPPTGLPRGGGREISPRKEGPGLERP